MSSSGITAENGGTSPLYETHYLLVVQQSALKQMAEREKERDLKDSKSIGLIFPDCDFQSEEAQRVRSDHLWTQDLRNSRICLRILLAKLKQVS